MLLVEQLNFLTTLIGYDITQGADMIAAVLLENILLLKLDAMLTSAEESKIVSALKNTLALKMSITAINEETADSLTAIIRSKSLIEIMEQFYRNLPYAVVLKMANALSKSIKILNVNNFAARDNIANFVLSKSVSSIKVFKNKDIDDGAADSIVAVFSNNSLMESINLFHNEFSYTGVLNIANIISKFNTIREVHISNSFIASDIIVDLTTALSKCPVLQELNLSQNLLTLTDILTIAQVFRHHPTLQTLDLSSNNISFFSAAEFIVDVILSVNQPLVNLNVCGKNIRPRCIDEFCPPSNDVNSIIFPLSNLCSLQHSSIDNPTNFIKAVEACPICGDDIMSYYIDHLGGVIYNKYHNYALVIPPGAVLQGDCVEIQTTANHFGPYVIPDGFYPISSYHWVSANYEFKAAVYLIMSHYAKIRSLEDIGNLYILQASAHDSNIMSESFTMCAISDGVYFDNETEYCVLATKHFCSYCQAKCVRSISEYFLASYCTYDEPSSESFIAEVCFCPANTECVKVTQC